MKVAVVGNYTWPHYQQALLDGFRSIPQTREAFPIKLNYYPAWNLTGTILNTIKLLYHVRRHSVDAVFIYSVDNILPIIFAWLKHRYKVKVLIYHNDDPYNKTRRRPYKHFFFLRSLKYSDITYVYRDVNVNEAKTLGAPKVKLLRSYFYSKLDISTDCSFSISNKKPCIVFIGHYEDDSRVEYLDALFRADINVHVYGNDAWQSVFEIHQWPLAHLHNAVYNQEYRKCLNSAYAALAFYSGQNRDDYTRRCFEIPMTKTLLFAYRSDFMASVFKDNENAVLFSSITDIVDKAKYILNNPQQTELMTVNGYKYVESGGFSEKDAAKRILSDIENLCV